MKFLNKAKWVLGIIIIFAVIIITNLIDKDNFNRVKNTVENIYKDRLIAKDLIFKISNIVHKKEIALATKNVDFFVKENKELNREMTNLLVHYERTYLTNSEQSVFESLQKEINSLKQQEKVITNTNNIVEDKLNIIQDIKFSLVDLSVIQLEEGKRQLSISKKALSTIELFTQIEIYFLIFLAITLQIVIIYHPQN